MSTVSSTLTTSALTAASSTFTTMGISEMSIVAVISLIALMSAREILSVSNLWNKRLDTVLNMAVFPLLFTFILIVAFKINAILNIM